MPDQHAGFVITQTLKTRVPEPDEFTLDELKKLAEGMMRHENAVLRDLIRDRLKRS